jgi:hypothetical protein
LFHLRLLYPSSVIAEVKIRTSQEEELALAPGKKQPDPFQLFE